MLSNGWESLVLERVYTSCVALPEDGQWSRGQCVVGGVGLETLYCVVYAPRHAAAALSGSSTHQAVLLNDNRLQGLLGYLRWPHAKC
jgi:hypothetical protein